MYQLLNGYEIISPTDPYFFKQYAPVLNLLIFKLDWFKFPFGLLLPLATIGLILGINNKEQPFNGFILVHFLAMITGLMMFSVTSRYRLFLIPFMAIYAASGLCNINTIASYNRRQAAFLTLFVIVSLTVANGDLLNLEKNYSRPEIRSQPYFALGRVLIRQGRYVDALPPLQQAVNIDPSYTDSWVDLGRANS